MNKIDTSEWKDFRVGDLFDIHPTRAYKLTNAQLIEEDGTNPVVVNSAYNNGHGGYSSQPTTEHGNMVTFSDTVDANTIFYQSDDFIGYPHVQGLYPIANEQHWNKYTYQFFVSLFKKTALTKQFDYGNKFRRDIAIQMTVRLPITAGGEPDWQYMEDYMKKIEEKAKDKLLSLSLDRTKSKIDTSHWKEFRLSRIVDEYYISKSLDYGHLQEGDTVFINRSKTNNGIQGYVDAKAYEKPDCITIGMIGNSKHAFWQTTCFVTSQNILVLRNQSWNNYSASYICSIINSLLNDFQDYKDIIKKDEWMNNTHIKLPITSTGEPDWQYMENYMKAVELKAKKKLEKLA